MTLVFICICIKFNDYKSANNKCSYTHTVFLEKINVATVLTANECQNHEKWHFSNIVLISFVPPPPPVMIEHDPWDRPVKNRFGVCIRTFMETDERTGTYPKNTLRSR